MTNDKNTNDINTFKARFFNACRTIEKMSNDIKFLRGQYKWLSDLDLEKDKDITHLRAKLQTAYEVVAKKDNDIKVLQAKLQEALEEARQNTNDNSRLQAKVWKWLEKRGVTDGAVLYTREEWSDKGETMGDDSLFTIMTDGADLHHYFNYDMSYEFLNDFNDFLAKLGIYCELGYTWTVHFYPAD